MSVLKGLKQISRDSEREKELASPQVVASRLRRVFLRGFLILTVFIVLTGLCVFLINLRIKHLNLPNQPAAGSGPQVTVDKNMSSVSKQHNSAHSMAEASATDKSNSRSLLRQQLHRDISKAKAKEELTRPTQTLNRYFSVKARKNESILSLERKLNTYINKNDFISARAILKKISTKIKRSQNPILHKWEGYMALKQKNYILAESCYRRALSVRPDDFNSNLNLIYSLIGQKKRKAAIAKFRVLHKSHPLDNRLESLGKQLGIL